MLSKRLLHIAQLVKPNSVLADIGCDHGLLPIYLVQQHIIKKAYACDINVGPLQRAKAAIATAELDGTISTILTDGLKQLPDDVTTIVIAGMGLETIQKILEDSFSKLCMFEEIIIQSNTDVISLRSWISEHRFTIIDDIVIEDGHFYQIIKFNTQKGIALDEDQLIFGMQQTSADFKKYCQYEYQKTMKILQQLPPHHEHYKDFIYYKERLSQKMAEKEK